MPKATLTFNLPEESSEFQTAVKAGSMASALWEIKQDLFRPARKHGYMDGEIQELMLKLDELARKDADPTGDNMHVEYKGASDLIGLLETMFYRILNDHEVAEID